MKKIYYLMLLFGLVLYGCGGSVVTQTDGGTANDTTTESGAAFTSGGEVILKTSAVTDSGGTITVSGTGTYLDGAKVVFPAGALEESTNITIGYNTGTLAVPSGTSATGAVQTLTLHTSGATEFSQPVEITVPYTDTPPVPFYIDSDGRLNAVLVTDLDTANKTLTFVTTHASMWTWVLDVVTDSPDEDTGFRPTDDGFNIANMGSLYHTDGECFGMTTFAQWYYDKKMSASGELYTKYLAAVGTDSSGKTIVGQDVIATRAFSAANQSWNWSQFILPNVNTTDEYRYNAITAALKLTKRPVNLSIKQTNAQGNFIGGHAVLAYGVDEDDGQIFIYDPNHPGETTNIIYDKSAKAFQAYGNYTKFFLNGTGTYSLAESYENIYEDAEHNFTSDNKPHITITSHTNGATVTERNIVISGSIESSEVLISKLYIYVGSEMFTASVAQDGTFSAPVSLKAGLNKFSFITSGMVGNSLTEVTPNNTDTTPFSVTLDVDTSVMLVTLTWDKADTDLDLYVIDPSGGYSAYYNKTTADGGELDYDVTTGYGPEHWTLTTKDTIRWDQDGYNVRVHYYSDHENGGTNYTLSVKLYEDTDFETTYVMTGYMSASNPYNTGPSNTGGDWQDFYMPVTLESVYYTALPVAMYRSALAGKVTAYVPPLSERIK